MSNHFKIIVPFYNVEEWIGKCIKSVQLQNHENFQCILVDDMSTDDSYENAKNMIASDDRFLLVKNKQKKYALKNIFDAIILSGTDEDDIIIPLDGDDWLSNKRVLSILSEKYRHKKCLMTYGSYIEYPSLQKGNFCKPIQEQTIKENTYRKERWVSSHLRTFKRHLWNNINIEDLEDENGEFYRMTWDMAFMFPMLEMSGPLALHIPDILYIYNRKNPLNDDKVDHRLQLETEVKIREKRAYKQNFATCEIVGGLGNQLFCVASALAYSLENNKHPLFPAISTNTSCAKYAHKFYKNLNYGLDLNIYHNTYREKKFSYDPIPFMDGNIKLAGYFQSFKYFETHKEEIFEMLNIGNIKKDVRKKYGDYSNLVSLHVRRGDYLKLSHYHHNLDIDYYKRAVNIIGPELRFVVFSDDIEWCKKNFNFIKNVTYHNPLDSHDYEDMMLMASCRHNIIANSSFSWWGAFINSSEDKIVVAPKRWFGPNYKDKDTKDLYCDGWKIL
jgi:glycosyltransferase involved in cell wall biosynthesis